MLSDNLFENILIEPASHGADSVMVVSGYASAAMAFHHFQSIKDTGKEIAIKLIIGMCIQDGISQSNHRAFQYLMNEDLRGHFECSYLISNPPVHSKLYVWCKGNEPISCFVGSANYTQNAFSKNQREIMTNSDPGNGYSYFQSLIPQTIYCNNQEAEYSVQIYNNRYAARIRRERDIVQIESPTIFNRQPSLIGLPFVDISLLDNFGKLPDRSGLNWGQRPEYSREPNQAYIRIPANIYKSDFFPPRGIHFSVQTDDGKVLICTRAQDNGKAIETPHNNSLIGEYFRFRLGLPNGAKVTLDDLNRYGRTDINFFKIDDETYFMDFSKPVSG